MISITLDHGVTEEDHPELMRLVREHVATFMLDMSDEPQTHNALEIHVPIKVRVRLAEPDGQYTMGRVEAPEDGFVTLIGFACSNSPESGFSEYLALIDGEIVGSEAWNFEFADEGYEPWWDNGRYHDYMKWYEDRGFNPPHEWVVR